MSNNLVFQNLMLPQEVIDQMTKTQLKFHLDSVRNQMAVFTHTIAQLNNLALDLQYKIDNCKEADINDRLMYLIENDLDSLILAVKGFACKNLVNVSFSGYNVIEDRTAELYFSYKSPTNEFHLIVLLVDSEHNKLLCRLGSDKRNHEVYLKLLGIGEALINEVVPPILPEM